VDGLIEGNLLQDSVGYNAQIKHQKARPNLPGMPVRKSVTIIRHNVFMKGPNSATDKLARPNLLVGHFPPSGPGAEDTYLI
jgi:ribosomal protein S12